MLRRPGSIGMRTSCVIRGCSRIASSKPVGSGPNNSASPGRYSISVCQVSAWVVNPNTRASGSASIVA